ncbi:hypothetical protein COY16_04420 [Candidatus Roizmanbacteria bacterium CG_4_10_14_0_2_um_filter_39_13]|uniref:Uncharacterized protein n=1 Tax=Candidatus Roizmanbacteria bacterium CG_4_10_14_0_2_um_filter_39_13 TaxID=1974825 RepID=A0A2M7TXB3_9BACT|nr:MAG: hypothetical protein COY16_04420 [Candidatus Roizmanbacteria bacterium CG_4_10_14_0_2_um_filter_39_13]
MNQQTSGFLYWLSLIAIEFILLFFGISAIYQGIRGLSGKKMKLLLKDHYSNLISSDSVEGIRGYFWGAVYIIFGCAMVGVGLLAIYHIVS